MRQDVLVTEVYDDEDKIFIVVKNVQGRMLQMFDNVDIYVSWLSKKLISDMK